MVLGKGRTGVILWVTVAVFRLFMHCSSLSSKFGVDVHSIHSVHSLEPRLFWPRKEGSGEKPCVKVC